MKTKADLEKRKSALRAELAALEKQSQLEHNNLSKDISNNKEVKNLKNKYIFFAKKIEKDREVSVKTICNFVADGRDVVLGYDGWEDICVENSPEVKKTLSNYNKEYRDFFKKVEQLAKKFKYPVDLIWEFIDGEHSDG